MKNPILVPEFRESFSHNNTKALRGICQAVCPVVMIEQFSLPTELLVPMRSPLSEQSTLWRVMRGVCHDERTAHKSRKTVPLRNHPPGTL